MITEYTILQAYSINDLMNRVREFLAKGWQPLGGTSTTNVRINSDHMPDKNGAERVIYTQAMAK